MSEIRSKQNIYFLQPKNILSLTLHNISRLYRLERNLLQEKASQLSTRMLDIEDENNELKEQVTSNYYIQIVFNGINEYFGYSTLSN